MKAKNKTFRAYFFTKYGRAFIDIKAETFINAFNKLPQKYKKYNTTIEELETREEKSLQEIFEGLTNFLKTNK
jgi:t-SNARE complex subunit (syntaxin)